MRDNPSILSAAVLFSSLLTSRAYAGEGGVKIYPPHSVAFGKSLGDWGDAWWIWVISIPEDNSPIVSPTGALCQNEQSGPVFFLVGNFGGQTTRDLCTVPCGKTLFFPVVNDIEQFPTSCNSCEDCRGLTKRIINNVDDNFCEIDGAPVEDLGSHREASSQACFTFTAPPGNILGLPPGNYFPAASDGYWLMVEPLSPGKHTIHIKGSISDPPFALEVTYNLTVEPCRFRRGDVDDDSNLNLTDAIAFLEFQFLGGEKPPCLDSADIDDSGHLDVNDPVYLLTFMYLAGDPIPFPGPQDCGEDKTGDDEYVECASRCNDGA